MVKIPLTSSPLHTSSLCEGYVKSIDWPVAMPETARKSFCKVLAQVVGPLREHLKDTSVQGPQQEETQDDLMMRITNFEISVAKKLEQFEVSWVTAAEAITELELTLCKQKLDKIQAAREAHQRSEFSVLRPVEPSVLCPTAAEETSSATAAAAAEEETCDPIRGRKKGTRVQGSRARTVSPLMVPVLWGLGVGVPTGLLPLEVLQAHSRATDGSIIRRSTPDAHPKWRLLAPDHPQLRPWRPQK